jgi:hypothetical protein
MTEKKTLDPQLTVIRTREAGADFYDSVIGRMRARSEFGAAGNSMFHFSGTFEDEFFSVTAYREPADSEAMFSEFTIHGIEDTLRAGSVRPDLTRREFSIIAYAVRDDADLQGYRITESGDFVAVLVTDPTLQPDRYRRTTKAMNFPKTWPEGQVIHVACDFGGQLGVFDIWRGDADRNKYYGEVLTPAISALDEDIDPGLTTVPLAIDLHSLYINRGTFEDAPDFLRQE